MAQSLSFVELNKRAKTVEREQCRADLKLAVLADCASQHFCKALSSQLKLQSIWPQVFEAEFNDFESQLLDPESEMMKFQPQAIVFLNCIQGLEDKVRKSGGEIGQSLVDEVFSSLKAHWESVPESVSIVQSNFCLPIFRPFGNFSAINKANLVWAAGALNQKIEQECRQRDNLYLYDLEAVSAFEGKKVFFDERLWVGAKQAISLACLPTATSSLCGLLRALIRGGRKLVVLDLDNTTWGGILADEGVDGLELSETPVGELHARFQFRIQQLKNKGMLLAAASKNSEAAAREVFELRPEMILKEDDFATFRVNYQDKATNIAEIQEELNIGLDSFVFFDDTNFEREIVRTAHPDVLVPEFSGDISELDSVLFGLNPFESFRVTDEDKKRTQLYQENKQRVSEQKKFGTFSDFLKSLEMRLEISDLKDSSLERVFQLFQRSNQFNLTTIRYNKDELKKLWRDSNSQFLVARLYDRLGDNGIVSILVTRVESSWLEVESWIMSCRVLKRGVEEVLMNTVFELAQEKKLEGVKGWYRPTRKNEMVKEHYKRFGFLPSERTGDPSRQGFTLSVAEFKRQEHFLSVQKVLENS